MTVQTESGELSSITAQDIIKRAYRIAGDIGAGEALTADQSAEGLEGLNAMLDSFSIEKLMIYEIRQESLTWPAGTVSRTIGNGADFNTNRPERVENGTFFEDSNNISYPVEIIKNRAVYDAIVDKTIQSAYPERLFYNPSVTWGSLYVYPVPNQALTFYLNSWQPLQVFDTLTEAHVMPKGYRRMLAYNLAVEMEAEIGLPLPPNVYRIAADSKAAIKRHNHRAIMSSTDVFHAISGQGRSDIVAGR